jgi:hypothetical protein
MKQLKLSGRFFCLSLLIFLLTVVPLRAQEDTPDADTQLSYGVPMTGELDGDTPSISYTFDAQRGEVISITLSVVSGDLDPLLYLLDANNNVLVGGDDSEGSTAINIEALRMPDIGTFTLVVARFGYSLGSTSGEFVLTVDRIGVSSEQGSTLRYGDFVINTITDIEPLVYYLFTAQRGDIVNISMDTVSGTLDPYLQVVDSNATLLTANDDVPGSFSLDAQVSDLVIQEDGVYVIIASRYGQAAGNSTGTFVLTLNTSADSGLGNTPQTAQRLVMGDVVENEITAQRPVRYYYFDASQNDIISIRMTRLGSGLDPLIALTDSNLNQILENDDAESGETVNSAITNYMIPATGRYYIIATRYLREEGTTTGRFRLELQGQGNAFDGVSNDVGRITYGTTVTGFIDDLAPSLIWAFWGQSGDVITVSMTRGDGNLDPVVIILNDTQQQLTSDDDSGNEQDARIDRYTLPRTGVYYVVASRYSGTEGDAHTSGSFTLVLARRYD